MMQCKKNAGAAAGLRLHLVQQLEVLVLLVRDDVHVHAVDVLPANIKIESADDQSSSRAI